MTGVGREAGVTDWGVGVTVWGAGVTGCDCGEMLTAAVSGDCKCQNSKNLSHYYK